MKQKMLNKLKQTKIPKGKILDIVTIDNNLDFLRQTSEPLTIEQIKSDEVQKLIIDMIETTNSKEDRAGLSAVQVGKLYRLLIVALINEDYEFTGEIVVMINPTIEIEDYTQTIDGEACLSIPNKIGKVARYRKIKATYLDQDGNTQKLRFTGFNARVVQHENDHLNGILFTDRLVG